MSDNFVHLLILLGVAGGAIPRPAAPQAEIRPTAATVKVACRNAAPPEPAAPRNGAARPCQESAIQTKQR